VLSSRTVAAPPHPGSPRLDACSSSMDRAPQNVSATELSLFCISLVHNNEEGHD
jgi:hypothetical protein